MQLPNMGEVEEEIGRALASPFRVKNQKLKPIFLQAERGEKQTNEFTNNYGQYRLSIPLTLTQVLCTKAQRSIVSTCIFREQTLETAFC